MEHLKRFVQGGGLTPLHKAAKDGNITDVRVAVQHHGSKIDDQERDLGYTALHFAAWYGYDAIARELLARCANPNLLDKEGRTPLHLAAQQGHGEVVKALLRGNANKEIRDKLNRIPWDYCFSKHPNVAQIIGAPAGTPVMAGPVSSAAFMTRPQQQQQPQQLPQQQLQQQPQQQQQQQQQQQPAAQPRPKATPIYPHLPPTNPPPLTPAQQQQLQQQLQQQQRQQQQQPPAQSAGSATGYAAPAPQDTPYPGPAYPGTQGAAQPSPPSYSSYHQGYQQAQPSAPPQQPAIAYQPPVHVATAYMQSQQPQQQQQRVQEAAAVPLPTHGRVNSRISEEDWAPSGADWATHPEMRVPGAVAGAGHTSESGTGRPPMAPPRPGAQQQQQQQQHNPLQGLKSAADLALQQLARLGLGQQGQGQQGGHKPPLAHIMGGIVAAAQALAGNHHHNNNNNQQPAQQQHQGAGSQSGSDPARDGLVGPLGSGGSAWAAPSACRTYAYADLAAATQGFAASNKIGQGGFGAVYRGVLDGVTVAVKVMDVGPEAMQGTKEFSAEVNILGRLHHPHVVLLIGACPEQGLLVYELAEGGSLEDRLFNPKPELPALPWQDRVRIAAEVASALLYLHSAPEPIVHMDIKPANILLDRTLRAKLGDVGLARLMGGPLPAGAPIQGGSKAPSTAHDSQLVGTLAYVDPEYLRTGQFSTKSDVYALGMVMLQLLTGQDKRNVITTVEEARRNVLYFAYVLDSRAGAWPAAEAMAFADVALKCSQFRRQDRPDLRTEILPALLQLRGRTALYDPPPPSAVPPSREASAASWSSNQPAGGKAASGAVTGSGPSSGVASGAMGPMQGGVPAMFVCPITQDVMVDPVVAADGYTYEREAIAAWLTRASTSPLTNLPLQHSALVPNMLVRSAIRDWQDQQQHAAHT